MKFPSKKIERVYNRAIGKVFTWSPSRQVFADQDGETDYDYSAMLWLKEKGILFTLPYDGKSISFKFVLKH